MGRHIHLATHLSVADLEKRYRAAHEPHERSWWQILWLLACDQTATTIAASTGYNRGWIGQIAKRYNEQRPAGMVNRQRTASWRAPRMLSAALQEELQAALVSPAPDWPKQAVASMRHGRLDGGQTRPTCRNAAWLGLPPTPQAQPADALAAPCPG